MVSSLWPTRVLELGPLGRPHTEMVKGRGRAPRSLTVSADTPTPSKGSHLLVVHRVLTDRQTMKDIERAFVLRDSSLLVS